MTPDKAAILVVGSCIICWFTGYGYGVVVHFLRRIFGKAAG